MWANSTKDFPSSLRHVKKSEVTHISSSLPFLLLHYISSQFHWLNQVFTVHLFLPLAETKLYSSKVYSNSVGMYFFPKNLLKIGLNSALVNTCRVSVIPYQPLFSVLCLWLVFLPPLNKVCEGYVFTGVCLSVHRGGVPWQVPPQVGTSPWQVHHPGQGTLTGRYTSPGRYPPGRYTTLGRVPSIQVHPPGRYTPGRVLPRQVHPPGRYTAGHSACFDTVNKPTVPIPLECILCYWLLFNKMHMV